MNYILVTTLKEETSGENITRHDYSKICFISKCLLYKIRRQLANEEKVNSKYVRLKSLIEKLKKSALTNQEDRNEQADRRK